ncbi:hypothetical protein FGB62_137g17 [Gracilaria domingensis]|nr:hypothetical protein FGB62_137g17 [Gracilaria domingensis]
MSIEYRKILIPEEVGFPLDRIKVPSNASTVVIRHEASLTTDGEEVLHVKSGVRGNLAEVPTHSISPSLRKTLWRLNHQNRKKENQNRRKRYQKKWSSESDAERENRRAKRRKWYTARKKSASDDGDSISTVSDRTEHETSSHDEPVTIGRYLYELKEDMRTVRCFKHYLKVNNVPISDNETVLRICSESDVATPIRMKAAESNKDDLQATCEESCMLNSGVDEDDSITGAS